MDSFEQKIIECVNEKLNDGTVERLIEEKLEKGISDAISEAFSYNDKAKKTLISKIEETMVPVIEKHDFNKYLVKLDGVLTELINNTSLVDNKVILEHFSQIMKPPVKEFNAVPISQIYERYQDYVSRNIDTSNLEIDTDDEPTYCDATVNMEVVEKENRWFSRSDKKYIVKFTCDEDEGMNCELELSEWSDGTVRMNSSTIPMDIHSLSTLSDFEIFIQQLYRAYVKIELDIFESEGDSVEIYDTPEVSFS